MVQCTTNNDKNYTHCFGAKSMSNGTVLITGASSGIGEELARIFAEKHYDLIISARREKRLQALAEELGADSSVTCIVCDLSMEEGPAQLVEDIRGHGLEVDILVNNAGVSYQGLLQDLSLDEVDDMINLNVLALTRLTHMLLPDMIHKGSGKVLNVGSVASFQPMPSASVYGASKAFVLSFTEALSEDLRGTGVTVSALCPGLTRTEMIDDAENSELIPSYLMASARSVAKEGYDALMKAEVIRVPGLANQAAVTWTRYQPRWMVRGWGGLLARMQESVR
jgi:short-subunit dehydrogenase